MFTVTWPMCATPQRWGRVPCDIPQHHPSHLQSKDMSPATPAVRDVSHVHCPTTPREQGRASTTRAISRVPHVHRPLHLREPGHVPGTTCHWGHIPCALSPRHVLLGPRPSHGSWDMAPGHVPLEKSLMSLPAVGTRTCPRCHIKCTSHVHGPLCHGRRDMSPGTHGTGDASHVHCPTTLQ